MEKNLQQSKAKLDMAGARERGLRLQQEQLGISTQQVAQGLFANAAPVCSPIFGVAPATEISVIKALYLQFTLADHGKG